MNFIFCIIYNILAISIFPMFVCEWWFIIMWWFFIMYVVSYKISLKYLTNSSHYWLLSWKKRKLEIKIEHSLFSSGKRHTSARICTIYNKRRLYSTKGYKKNKGGIIMKAITYRINLYTTIGKFSFDMLGERRGVHYYAKLNSIMIRINITRNTTCMSITELTIYHYVKQFVVKLNEQQLK